MAEFSFCFTESSFLQLNGQKHLRSVAEDSMINDKQKITKRIYQKRRRHGHFNPIKPRGGGGLRGPDDQLTAAHQKPLTL